MRSTSDQLAAVERCVLVAMLSGRQMATLSKCFLTVYGRLSVICIDCISIHHAWQTRVPSSSRDCVVWCVVCLPFPNVYKLAKSVN
jgi:hypothetical protein